MAIRAESLDVTRPAARRPLLKPPDELPPPTDRYAVLRIRDLQLYLSGRFAATFGQQMLNTAIGWELYQRTNSTVALAMVGVAQITPLLLLTLPAGHVADQHDRRAIVVWTEIVMAISCAGLTFVSWSHAPVGLVYLCLSINATARAFLAPASVSILPQMVPPALFPSAVMWNSGSFQLSAALGPVVGGLATELSGGPAGVYAFNVLAALFYAFMIWNVRSRPAEAIQPRKMTMANLWAGVRYVFDTPVILSTITLDLFAVLLGGATALLPCVRAGHPARRRERAGLAAGGDAHWLGGDGAPARAPAADGARGPLAVVGGGRIRVGDGGVRLVALIRAVDGDARRARHAG